MVLQVAQQGLTWGALGQSITPDFPFSGRGVFIVVAADIFIYALLTAYLDQVGDVNLSVGKSKLRFMRLHRAVPQRSSAKCTKVVGMCRRGRRHHHHVCNLQSTLSSTTSCTRPVPAGLPANRQP